MSAIPADLEIAGSPWRRALPALLILIAVILGLYWRTAAGMVEIWWRSETFAHAFLVLPISLWLIWRQRTKLAVMTPRAQPWALLPLLAVAAIWLLADLVTVNTAAQFALVAMLVLAVPAVLGLEVAWAILFPLLFLFFSVPFGEFLLPTLMNHTADFTVFGLQLSGVPVYREGNQFMIPTGTWSVVEACSGVRYLIASLMVGTLFAYLNYRSMWRRVAFIAVAAVVPIVANWLRAYMIVMLGYLSGNRIAVGVDHIIYGWVFFGIVITIMFLIGARWTEPDVAPAGTQAATGFPRPAGASARSLFGTLLVAGLILLLPLVVEHRLERSEADAAAPQLRLPGQLASGWSSAGASIASWKPEWVNPSAEAQAAYAGPAGTVGVYIGYYRAQGPQRKLVSSANALVKSEDHHWNQVRTGGRRIEAGGRTLSVTTADIQTAVAVGAASPTRLTAWRVYWVANRFIASDAKAKVAGALARLHGQGDDGAVLVLYAEGEPPAANAKLEAFAKANLAPIETLLERTRETR